MKQTALRFSVVIPCYNEARYLAATLESLQAQDFAGNYEIIVVDNNCTDDTAAIARAHGVRVVREKHCGVCWARQKGAEAARGEIVVSTDADTTFAPGWLAKIDKAFRKGDSVVAVAGPCRFADGPLWGKAYPRLLFGLVYAGYLATSRPYYITATNTAFKKKYWRGYDTSLTQGGDELDLLRNLRRQGKVVFLPANVTCTSGRRLSRGLFYNFFVTFLVYYLLAYGLNRLFKRQILGSAPAFRDSEIAALRHLQTVGLDAVILLLLVMPFGAPRHYIVRTSTHMVHYVTGVMAGRRPG